MIFEAIRSLCLEHGRSIARSQAHYTFERQEAILCCLANFDAEVAAQFVHEFIRAAQGTREVGANLHTIFTRFFVMI
jgi:hypothetical protein